MAKLENLKGKKYNRLTALKFIGGVKEGYCRSHWLFKCECGNEKVIQSNDVKLGKTKSCGCYNLERSVINNTTHNMSKTRFYKIWAQMINRCRNPDSHAYEHYGGRGVDYEWETFSDFKVNMYDSYLSHFELHGSYNTTIDRIDNDGNYSKENCRWATRKQQCNNRRNTIRLAHNGKTQIISEWAKDTGLNHGCIYARIKYLNWSTKEVLETPVRKRNYDTRSTRTKKDNGADRRAYV